MAGQLGVCENNIGNSRNNKNDLIKNTKIILIVLDTKINCICKSNKLLSYEGKGLLYLIIP